MNEATLNDQLQRLRLAQFKHHWKALEQQCLAEGWTPLSLLSKLCEFEINHRKQQRFKRYLSDAKLPEDKSMETLDLQELEGVNPDVIRHLGQQLDWVEQGENLLLFGASGLGKTHIAAAIAQELISQDIRGRFYKATALVQELQIAKQALKLNELLLKMDRYRFMVIDDIGYVNRDEHETSVLFELIAHRYERCSLIITTNQPFSRWQSIFANEEMAVAAVDRLIHHAHIIELEGEDSYRKKMARRRDAQAKQSAAYIETDI